MKLTSSMKIVAFEAGTIGGIILAAFTVPKATPLRTFLVISGTIFILANIYFLRAVKRGTKPNSANKGAWPHLLRVMTILGVYWLLVYLLP